MSIIKGQLVQVVAAADGKPTVIPWSPGASEQPGLDSGHKVMGVAMTDSQFEEPVAVMKRGYLRDVNEHNGETWAVGDILYAKSDGTLTKTRPAAPLPQVIVGTVIIAENPV